MDRVIKKAPAPRNIKKTITPRTAFTSAVTPEPTPSASSRATMTDVLVELISRGSRAMPNNQIVRGEAGNERYYAVSGGKTEASVEGSLSLDVMLPSLLSQDGHIDIDPPFQNAGAEFRLDTILRSSSRALGAGATLIEMPDDTVRVRAGSEVILGSRTLKYGTFEAAHFSLVDFPPVPIDEIEDPEAEGQVPEPEPEAPIAEPEIEVQVTEPPFHNSELDRDTMVSRALAFKFTRRQLKDKSSQRLASELCWSIAQGIGRAVDATLFDAIAALPANAWGMSKAAGTGIPFDTLRAVVGTGALGATASEGALYVQGVPAVLSPDLTPTIVGAWSRAAVVIDPDIRVQVTRIGLSGELGITVWLSLQALVPNPAMFWTVE